MDSKLLTVFHSMRQALKASDLGCVEFEPDETAHILRIKAKNGLVCGSITIFANQLPATEPEIIAFGQAKVKEVLGAIAKEPAYRMPEDLNGGG